MDFVEKIVLILKNPMNAMKSIAEQPMIEEAVMIVGIYAVLGAISAYVISYKITYVFEGFENMPFSMQSITVIFSVVGGLIGPFLLWLIGTGILHLISLALGGEGKFYPQMMTVVGYSMIPLIFGGIISIGLLSMVEPATITVSQTNPMAAKELYNNLSFFASNLIGTIMEIWASLILFFGVQSAQQFTSIKSAIVAGIPLTMSVIFFAWSIFSLGVS